MHFKHPEIFYFLFLLAIPIIIHLFQLRKFKTEYFTNVKFLKELFVQTRKSSKLKKYLLLATRLLLLFFLIFAFAQPFFKSKDSKNATNEMYIVLDNSFSMQAKGKSGELMKRAVQDLLTHCPENLNFSLITCSDNYWNTDIKSIEKELQNMNYSGNSFEINSLLSKINAHKSVYNKDIIVITDAVSTKSNFIKIAKDSDNLFFINPEAENKKNVAIDSVFIKQTLPNFYEISVKLTAFGDDFSNIPISLTNNKKLVAKTVISIDNKTKTIDFTIPKADFNGCVSLIDNGLDYDNNYYFSISKPKKSNVISIGDAEKSNFLKKIYTENDFNYQNFDIKSLDYNLLEQQDAIVLNEVSEIPSALQTTLKSFTQKGGNVILIPNTETSASSTNSLLKQISPIQLGFSNSTEKLISKINFSHPLFGDVFEKRIENFQSPKVKKSFEIVSSASSVLSYSDQSPFLVNFQSGISNVYVFSASINSINSNFQNSPIIVPTFYNMAKSAQNTGVSAIKIGQSNSVLVDAILSKEQILNVKNETESFIPVQQVLNKKVKLTFNDNPKKDGNFDVIDDKNSIKNISFNYDRTESNLENVNTSMYSDFKEMNSIENLFSTIQVNRTDSQIWKWFVFFALFFIVAEVLIQKFVK